MEMPIDLAIQTCNKKQNPSFRLLRLGVSGDVEIKAIANDDGCYYRAESGLKIYGILDVSYERYSQ